MRNHPPQWPEYPITMSWGEIVTQASRSYNKLLKVFQQKVKKTDLSQMAPCHSPSQMEKVPPQCWHHLKEKSSTCLGTDEEAERSLAYICVFKILKCTRNLTWARLQVTLRGLSQCARVTTGPGSLSLTMSTCDWTRRPGGPLICLFLCGKESKTELSKQSIHL